MADDAQASVTVSRTEFRKALKLLGTPRPARDSYLTLSFNESCLQIALEDGVADVPARGSWPEAVAVKADWLIRLGRKLPASDPLTLKVHEGRLYVGGVSHPCISVSDLAAESDRLDEESREAAVHEAARILAALHISEADLRELVERRQSEQQESWQADEIRAIEKAWPLLARFGVEPGDLRRLARKCVAENREVWRPGEKRMLELIARAWPLLARFGVEPADVRELSRKSVREAWKR